HRAELNAVVSARFGTLTAERAVALLDAAGIANARQNSVPEFLAHPVLADRDRWRQVDTPRGPIKALLPPADLARVEPRTDPVPGVGEHTAAILAELGRSPTEIADLRAAGVV